jgi:N-acetylglucosaminylphosphatidylinositol deacetylase
MFPSFEGFSFLDIIFASLVFLNVYLLVISITATKKKSYKVKPNISNNPNQVDNILLVIAHPDDESMFFVPTIRTLVEEPTSNVHILCLSTGNFDGLGSVRTEELYKCAKVLKIKKNHVKVVDDSKLQDGKNNSWLKRDVAKQVSSYVNLWSINKIITFDDYGVSGHENHTDTSRGVVYFYESSKWGNKSSNLGNTNSLYLLQSTNIFRKYTGIFDVMTSLVQDGSQCFCSLTPWINYAAMQAHFSQFVWYRRLFVLFSRYTYVNNLIKQKLATEAPEGLKKGGMKGE